MIHNNIVDSAAILRQPIVPVENSDWSVSGAKSENRFFRSLELASKQGYGTKRHWVLEGRQVRKGEQPTASILLPALQLGELLANPGTSNYSTNHGLIEELIELRRQEIISDACRVQNQAPLWHEDQTSPVKQTPRTRAYLQFERIYFDPSERSRYLWWNVEADRWNQQVIEDGDPRLSRSSS